MASSSSPSFTVDPDNILERFKVKCDPCITKELQEVYNVPAEAAGGKKDDDKKKRR